MEVTDSLSLSLGAEPSCLNDLALHRPSHLDKSTGRQAGSGGGGGGAHLRKQAQTWHFCTGNSTPYTLCMCLPHHLWGPLPPHPCPRPSLEDTYR